MRVFPLIVVLASSGCGWLKSPPQAPTGDWTKLGLPQKNGNGVLIEVAGSRLELSPTLDDALTRLGACTDAITYCYAPGEHSLDACVSGIATCDATLNPAGCCPQECRRAYEAARARGQEELAAFDEAFFSRPGCFPGVERLLEGAP